MAEKSDKDIENLVERGNLEKDRIKEKCFKNQKNKIASFFKDFRGYCKNSPSNVKEVLMLLNNELENTLTSADKEFLIKQWKPVASPIILLPSMEQFNELRNYINGFDLNRVILQPKPTNIPVPYFQQPATCNDFHQRGTQNIYEGSRVIYSSENTNGLHLVSGSHTDDNSSPDLPEDHLETSIETTRDFGNDIEVINEETACSTLINNQFNELSEIIQTNGDLLAAIDLLKKGHGNIVYESILQFCTREREPLTFQMAIKLDRYQPVLDSIYADGLFNLDQRNAFNLTIFYFLIQTDIESLYKFLRYTRDKLLQEDVHSICVRDTFFQRALSNKKREMANQSIQRRKLESMEKFCLVIDRAAH